MGQCGVDAGPVLADGAGEFHERGESTAPGPLQPGVEQRDAFGALELKHLPKLLLEQVLSLIHISEPTRLGMISYAVFCLKKKKNKTKKKSYKVHAKQKIQNNDTNKKA